MTRRILAALLALTGGLLVGAILPLGLAMTRQHETDFREAAVVQARAVATAAEEHLVDRPDRTALARSLKTLRGPDESIVVLNSSGTIAASGGSALGPEDDLDDLAAPAMAGLTRTTRLGDDESAVLVAAVPVPGHNGVAGTVLLARPLDPLDDRVKRLWAGLALESAAAVAAAVLLAIALARWVGRPLRDLEGAAEALGSGHLDVRAGTGTGPPDVRRLADRFNVMAARLETLIYDHRAVLADVSHQLRTPLAALRLRMELLAGDAPPDAAEDLEDALEELARLSRLVDGLLAVARAENTTAPPVPVRIDEALAERADAWRTVAEERGVRLTVRTPGRADALLGEGHLEQVLDNLIDNALNAVAAESGDGAEAVPATTGTGYEPGHGSGSGAGRRPEYGTGFAAGTGSGSGIQRGGPQGEVHLAAFRPSPGRIAITVADNGPGMPPKAREQAFHRFKSGRANGTGLGLAIVHRLVTSDGGMVALTETPGGGLTVTLDLPAPRP